ncbi:uncharacterized protein N7446_010048 [Penicillium canescens]|uniref:Uncharacterized protein n=1 Tax=Penicillium canescens TaxID=5083 RepID=A0AAD6N6P1_PENCN|nr:uncharacterized protein N7446_010048 [Penicillium canescens]KAJ6035288.1 hypothetical protein N7460_009463 [Penicillium canescens]KAJ6046946.1 hypothetical protein N7444_008200 [Penicillium canescens]KAJ6054036.1 hypothetical protein N7446_010048 [Penicillium canescens]
MVIGNHHQSIPIPETLHSLPGGHVAVLAGDELPPPRGARWELSEQQFGYLRVPGGAQQRDLPPFHDALTRRKPSLRTSRNTNIQNQDLRGSRAPSHVRPHDGERNLSPRSSCPTTVYGLDIDDDTLGSGQSRLYGSWAQHMDDAITTKPTTLTPKKHYQKHHQQLRTSSRSLQYFATSQLICVPTDVHAKRRVPDMSFCHETSA